MLSANGTQINDHTTTNNGPHGTYPDTLPLIIGGKYVVGSNKFPVRNPVSGDTIWEVGGASAEETLHAKEVAQAALPIWVKVKPPARRDIFLKAADLFAERKSELAQYQVKETGPDQPFVYWILNVMVDNLKEVAGKCSMVAGSIPFSTEEGRGVLVLKEPYWIILGIVL